MTSTAAAPLAQLFEPGSALASALPGYRPRAAQVEMAVAVAQALEDLSTLVVEAGTGVGKTLAYLVPALLSGRRVVISTGTKNLQDQLFHRDLPTVTGALGQPVRVALLKGRANYLCHYRFEQARSGISRHTELLVQIGAWLRETDTGDLAEVAALNEDHPLIPQITSTADNCLGQECPAWTDCAVVKARRAAQKAELVVVNHHLLLADFALREEGFGDLLGGADACIVDEAHQLPEIAARFFGTMVSARQVRTLLGDLKKEAQEVQGERDVIAALGDAARDALAAAREALGRASEQRMRYASLPSAAHAAFANLAKAISGLAAGLDNWAGQSRGLDSIASRAVTLATRLASIIDDAPDQRVRWADVTRTAFTLHSSPLEASMHLQHIMAARQSAWIFTSATLAVGNSFSHFCDRIGLQEPRTLKLGSPFDYASNTLLYLPTSLPAPQERGYTRALLDDVLPLVEAAQGGSFLLFTSRRALQEAAAVLNDAASDRTLLVQGEAPRHELLDRFRADGRALLLGNASFWEGVDVRGAALRLVVIDRLPFASPGDPLTEARLAALEARGESGFARFSLPQAVLALKQGVGRLVRDVNDTGVCVICDPRLTGKGYGKVFLKSLPPMPITRDRDAARDFLAAQTPA